MEEITYRFQIEFPSFYIGNRSATSPFTGTIDCRDNNMAVLLAGLYLVEKALENLDND